MSEFPYSADEIKACQNRVKAIECDLEVIRKALGSVKALINRSVSAWDAMQNELNPLTESIAKISETYKPTQPEWKDNMTCESDYEYSISLNKRENAMLSDLESAIDAMRKIKNISADDISAMIFDIRTLQTMLKPLKGWRVYRFVKNLYERGHDDEKEEHVLRPLS